MADDIDNFLARIDEYTSDSFCSGSTYSPEYQKLQDENKKLKQLLITKKDENNEILELYRQKSQSAAGFKLERDEAIASCEELRSQLEAVNKENINQTLSFKQQVNELMQNQSQQTKDYSDLCQEYLNVLSEMTCFYSYDIKRVQIKRTITKCEVFLRKTMGSAFEKPKIIQTKMGCDTDSVTSKVSVKASSKKRQTKSKSSPAKRRKTNIWDMKSISQAPSPVASENYLDETTSDLSSGVFSIGNETQCSLVQSFDGKPVTPCSCGSVDNNTILVSIGTNTDCQEVPPSVPRLLADDFSEEILDARNEVLQDIATEDHNFSSDETSEPEIESRKSSTTAEPTKTLVSTFVSCSTSTEPELLQTSKKLVDQGTSTEYRGLAVDKSTSTVHSLTTRGNQTVGVRQQEKTTQMPEVCLADIFEDTIFDLPAILSPLNDDVQLTKDANTITDLCNVTREIDWVRTPALTVDAQEPSPRNSIDDDTIFSLLGQTLFRLFLKRMQKSYKVVSNDDYARKKIWRLLRRELKDRYSELTFDELLNSMYVENEKSGASRIDDELYDELEMESKHTLKFISPIKDIECRPEKEDYEDGLPADSLTPAPMECSSAPTKLVVEESVPVSDLPSIAESVSDENSIVEESLGASHGNLNEPSEKSALESTPEEASKEPVAEKATEVTFDDLPIVALIENQSEKQSDPTSSIEEVVAQTDIESSESLHKTDVSDLEYQMQFEEALKELQSILPYPRSPLEPIDDLTEVIWNALFPETEEVDSEISPEDDNALDGFNIDHEPIDIPVDAEVKQIFEQPMPEYTEFETPKSPPPFTEGSSALEVRIIPTESRTIANRTVQAQLIFDPELRKSLVSWQNKHIISSKVTEKLLCQARKAITVYLKSKEWNQKSLDKCVKALGSISEPVLLQAIYETLEDNTMEDEISYEFTPPAPPLPRYQQKLILLVQNLSQQRPHLPHKLFEDLECKIFNLESFAAKSFEELRNLSYWATALIDLFLDGDPTIALYFIVKCIYFLGFKSIPMSFAVIKAFPSTIPKKSQLMKKYCKDIDWENMTGLQLSKVQMNAEWIDSLELTVIFLLTSGSRSWEKEIENHELFSFLPKFYGFRLSFITAPKLLDVLVQRLEAGRLENLALSFILLAKRTNEEFTIRTMLRDKLVPLLKVSTASDEMTPELTARVCLLIEIISSILKGFSGEKERSFGEIFALIVSILARSQDAQVKDTCLLAILRLQRFIDSQKEILNIVEEHFQMTETNMNDTLGHSIRTFVHRKNVKFSKKEI